jgi:hypothetical protein
MDDTKAAVTTRRMQSEILGQRLMDCLEKAVLPDQGEARDAARFALRLQFALGRVEELRASCAQNDSVFEEARLEVALTILEAHVFRAAYFIDDIARRQRSALSQVNRRIAGEAETVIDPTAAVRAA